MKTTKLFATILMLTLMAASVVAQEFPGPFVVEGSPVKNLVIVVADKAPADDLVVAARIATTLKAPTGSTKLASEIGDISKYNSIILGNACYNPLIALLLNNPEQCATSGLNLIKHANGNAALLIMGATPEEVRAYADRWLSSTLVQPLVAVPIEAVSVAPVEIRVPRPEEYQKCLAELEIAVSKVKEYEEQGYVAPGRREYIERGKEPPKPIPQDVWNAYQALALRCSNLAQYANYDACIRAYNDQAQSLRNRMDEPGAKRVEYEGLIACGKRFGRLIPPEPKEYPEYEKCMTEGKRRILAEYGEKGTITEEPFRELEQQCATLRPVLPEENPEYKACIAELDQNKLKLLEYEKRGERPPEELMREFQAMQDRCMILLGWRYPAAVPVVPMPPELEKVEPEKVVPAADYVPPAEQPCIGCKQNGACLQYGIRLVSLEGKPMYCDIDGAFKLQKALGESCQNNHECVSNSCADQRCVSVQERLEAVEKELKEQRGILQKIMDFFKRLFGG
ncbi:MAG: hypothetical protein QXT19_02880 [Candidatus Woesearchaeota archaeon]